MWLRILKSFLVYIASFIGLILFYFLCSFILARIPVNNDDKLSGDIPIWIRSNGVHADIVVPVQTSIIDWSELVKYEYTKGNDTTAKWVAFGWGDKGFYLQTPTWSDLKFSVAFKALTGLSDAAMHVTFYNTLAENEKCRSISISAEQYKKLVSFIRSGFDQDSKGDVIHIVTDANYNDHDAFYEAEGTYSLFHTCNTWTNNALKFAGLPAGYWTPFEGGVLYYYR